MSWSIRTGIGKVAGLLPASGLNKPDSGEGQHNRVIVYRPPFPESLLELEGSGRLHLG